MNTVLKNLKHLPYGGASAVMDPDLSLEIDRIMHKVPLSTWLNDVNIHHQFVGDYQRWISKSKHNSLLNLDLFPVAVMGTGTTEGFEKFYLKNSQRRFRCFHGEYMYHAAAWRNYFPNWCRIEDDDIKQNDAVVISLPFSDTGNPHHDMYRVLDACDQLGVPVLIDCAFYGICQGIEFDFNRNCITDITFSLSKTFPISHVRTGMRLTRYDDDDSMLVHHKTAYVNRVAAGLGIELMKRLDADYNVDQWSSQQQKFCDELGVQASQTVIFGLGGQEWGAYNRGGNTSRLNFAKYLYEGILPNE